MSRLKIDKNKSNFILDGKPFFYLADTIWSAFTNVTLEEWEYYLKVRKAQGFTVLQINTMPQWDRCMADVGVYPFAIDENQGFDFSAWQEEYYIRARKMCQMAVEEGFCLALVVLWLNHVPGTWGSHITDRNVMPRDFVEEYASRVVKEFDCFDPVYVVSGDTDFDTPEAVEYYKMALETVCRESPDSLKTLHIKRGYDIIPSELLEGIDFYMFQSGHNSEGQEMAYVLPENFREKYPKKPLVNGEPCYEQMGYSRRKYGRFGREDVRRAAWSSLLSGAYAGVTYGAHGVWNWKRINPPKNPIMGEGFDEALVWQEALKLPGAWDYGYIRWLLEIYGVSQLVPAREKLENQAEEIRIAKGGERYFIYVPYNTKITLLESLPGYEARVVDLEERRIARAELEWDTQKTWIKMHAFEKDVLLIVEKSSC